MGWPAPALPFSLWGDDAEETQQKILLESSALLRLEQQRYTLLQRVQNVQRHHNFQVALLQQSLANAAIALRTSIRYARAPFYQVSTTFSKEGLHQEALRNSITRSGLLAMADAQQRLKSIRDDEQQLLDAAARLQEIEARRKQSIVKIKELQAERRVQQEDGDIAVISQNTRWIAPLYGERLTKFGERVYTNAPARSISIAADQDSLVFSPQSGRVLFADFLRGYGNMVILQHQQKYVSILSGLGSIDIQKSDWLEAGEPIGRMGGAQSDQQVLLIEMRVHNRLVNPELILPPFNK